MIIINGIDWDLRFVDSNNPNLIRSDGSRTVGVTVLPERTIYIANNLIPHFEWRVLCHEIVHCAMYSYNIELTIDQEELIADLIATYGREIIETTDRIFAKLHRRWIA